MIIKVPFNPNHSMILCVSHDLLGAKLRQAPHPLLSYPGLQRNQTKHPANTGTTEYSKILPHMDVQEVQTSGFTTVPTGVPVIVLASFISRLNLNGVQVVTAAFDEPELLKSSSLLCKLTCKCYFQT